jgi:hypothetical protein
MTAPTDVQRKKDLVERLITRARNDAVFRKSFKDDPVGILQREGFEQAGITEILREEGYRDIDPKDPTLTAGQRAAINAARRDDDCWLSCPCSGCCITSI